MKKIRWGIIGTGRIANTFAKAICSSKDCELTAVASRTKEKARIFAEKYRAEKNYASYEELASDKEIDIVYIATPTASHYADTMMCLKKGKSVLCEKPASLNREQLSRIIQLAKEKDLFFMEAMWMKCNPVFKQALSWVKEGKIGTPKAVKADFCSMCEYDENDRLFRPDCGGGALLDLGVYTLTFACCFLGFYPDEISSNAVFGKSNVDMFNSIILHYKNGSHASLTTSFSMPCENGAVVLGEKGSIVFDRWFFCTDKVSLYDENNKLVEQVVIENKVNGYEYEVEEVNRCIREGVNESVYVPHDETMAVMEIMDKCRKDWGFVYPGE